MRQTDHQTHFKVDEEVVGLAVAQPRRQLQQLNKY